MRKPEVRLPCLSVVFMVSAPLCLCFPHVILVPCVWPVSSPHRWHPCLSTRTFISDCSTGLHLWVYVLYASKVTFSSVRSSILWGHGSAQNKGFFDGQSGLESENCTMAGSANKLRTGTPGTFCVPLEKASVNLIIISNISFFYVHHTVHWPRGHSQRFDVFHSPGWSFVLWFTFHDLCTVSVIYPSWRSLSLCPPNLMYPVWKLSVLDTTNRLTLQDIGMFNLFLNHLSCIPVPVNSDHEKTSQGGYNFQSFFWPVPMETDTHLHPFPSVHFGTILLAPCIPFLLFPSLLNIIE